VDFPPVLVDREIDSLLKERDFIFREQGGLQGYLKNLNKTEQGMKEELRPEAVRRITESLVLGKVIEQEKITVDAAEIAAEIESMTKDAGDRVEEMKRMLGTDQARQVVEERQLSLKALQKLTEIALNNIAEGPKKTA
jgi:trigger factor